MSKGITEEERGQMRTKLHDFLLRFKFERSEKEMKHDAYTLEEKSFLSANNLNEYKEHLRGTMQSLQTNWKRQAGSTNMNTNTNANINGNININRRNTNTNINTATQRETPINMNRNREGVPISNAVITTKNQIEGQYGRMGEEDSGKRFYSQAFQGGGVMGIKEIPNVPPAPRHSTQQIRKFIQHPSYNGILLSGLNFDSPNTPILSNIPTPNRPTTSYLPNTPRQHTIANTPNIDNSIEKLYRRLAIFDEEINQKSENSQLIINLKDLKGNNRNIEEEIKRVDNINSVLDKSPPDQYWKVKKRAFFESLSFMGNMLKKINKNSNSYEIKLGAYRAERKSSFSTPKRKGMGSQGEQGIGCSITGSTEEELSSGDRIRYMNMTLPTIPAPSMHMNPTSMHMNPTSMHMNPSMNVNPSNAINIPQLNINNMQTVNLNQNYLPPSTTHNNIIKEEPIHDPEPSPSFHIDDIIGNTPKRPKHDNIVIKLYQSRSGEPTTYDAPDTFRDLFLEEIHLLKRSSFKIIIETNQGKGGNQHRMTMSIEKGNEMRTLRVEIYFKQHTLKILNSNELYDQLKEELKMSEMVNPELTLTSLINAWKLCCKKQASSFSLYSAE